MRSVEEIEAELQDLYMEEASEMQGMMDFEKLRDALLAERRDSLSQTEN